MTLVVAWFVFPVVLGILSLGCGLVVERASGFELAGVLRLPVGFALLSLVAYLAVVIGPAVQFATPAVVALAVVGYELAFRGVMPRLPRSAWPAIIVAVGVYAVFAAPALLSGTATFLGYIKLDDTATYLAMLDRAMQHGYNTVGLNPSTYQRTLDTSLAYGYPLGSLLPLGVGHMLLRTDNAWLWQPYLSFLAAILALCLYDLAGGVVRARWLRQLVAFVAAQAALIYGYALWGGIKEIVAAVLIALGAALAPATLRALDRPRSVIPLAIVSAAFVGVLSVGGAVWLAPLLLIVLGFGVTRLRTRVLPSAAVYVVAVGLLAIPAFVAARTWLSHTGSFTGGSEYGNLSRRLSVAQVLGIWPSGDFRTGPLHSLTTDLLLAIVAAGVVLGLVLAIRSRSQALLAAAASAFVGCIVYVETGSPWIGGKALASASPIVLTIGLAGFAALLERGRRAIGIAALVLVAGGVFWSNMLQYHSVDIAPSGQLRALEGIGKRFAGEGPTLLTSFQSYGARHFLRSMDAEAASELRVRPDLLQTGEPAATGVSPDIDELALGAVLEYRTLVLARSPLESRPPSVYRLIESGKYWDVWQRPDAVGQIAEHISLGSRYVPAAIPACSQVLSVAQVAAAHGGLLAAVERPPAVVVEATGTSGPPSSLGSYGEDVNALYLRKASTVLTPFTVSSARTYGVWIGGTSRGEATVTIDGQKIGGEHAENQWPGNFNFVGDIALRPGAHTLLLHYAGSSWRPGSSGMPEFGLGPLAIGVGTEDWPVTYVRPAQARTLCGKNLDWLEAVEGS